MPNTADNSPTVASQPPTPLFVYDDPPSSTPDRQAIPMILPIIIIFFFLVGFFTVYLFRDILQYLTGTWLISRGGASDGSLPAQQPEGPHGLHPSILASFPVFPYASIKRLRIRKCELVCAICLSEFCNDDAVRLLTICSHAFHPECIDLWLESHTTCPVCRCNLEKQPEELEETNAQVGDSLGEENSLRISVKDDDDDDDDDGVGSRVEELSRKSHSRGTSAASEQERQGRLEEEDEYTLRLPEDISERMLYLNSGTSAANGDVSGSLLANDYESARHSRS